MHPNTRGPEACASCGLPHALGELFVTIDGDGDGRPALVETCELGPARDRARAAPRPPGSVAYHSTRHPEDVLERGLDPARGNHWCKHVCLAETAEIAAGLGVGAVVLEVDVAGLVLFFELGEARHHGVPIGPERIRTLATQPKPDATGWSDPAWRRNHSDCLAQMRLPLSRRLLNAAEEEEHRRRPSPYAYFDEDVFRAVVAELAAREAGPGGEPNARALPASDPAQPRP